MTKFKQQIAIYRGKDKFFKFMRDLYVLVVGELKDGRVEVKPYIDEEKRFSWVTSDPPSKDIEYHPELTYTPERGIHEQA